MVDRLSWTVRNTGSASRSESVSASRFSELVDLYPLPTVTNAIRHSYAEPYLDSWLTDSDILRKCTRTFQEPESPRPPRSPG